LRLEKQILLEISFSRYFRKEIRMAHLITGDSSKHTDEAIDWLKLHGATVVDFEGLSLITLPETMELDHGDPAWRYTVSLKDDENEEYVEICSDADPYRVEFYLER